MNQLRLNLSHLTAHGMKSGIIHWNIKQDLNDD